MADETTTSPSIMMLVIDPDCLSISITELLKFVFLSKNPLYCGIVEIPITAALDDAAFPNT